MGTSMADDGYTSSATAWDGATSDTQPGSAIPSGSILYQRPPRLESLDQLHHSHSHSNSISPPPRTSSDSVPRSSTSRWRDSPTINESTDLPPSASVQSESTSLVEPSFDENVLRALCEMDCGIPLLLDRIKQSMVSCREASVFFKKRAGIEEEYGKNLQKLARATSDIYSMNDGKAGSFVNAWQTSMRIHEQLGDNRIRFGQRLSEMSDELATLAKEVDKNRKQTKDLATRYERALQESELATEKSKARLDITSEELERLLLQKEGESLKDNALQGRSPGGVAGGGGKRAIGKAVAKGGLLLKGKNPGNIQRQEDDIRSRMSSATDTYSKALTEVIGVRQEYFNFQLPRILRALKECTDEIDLGTQYHLTRYAFLFESTVLSDGATLVPPADDPSGAPTGLGLKAAIELIDNRGDFKTYMQNYAYARGGTTTGTTPKVLRRDGPSDEGFLPPLPSHNSYAPYAPTSGNSSSSLPHQPQQQHSQNQQPPADKGRPTFGVDLSEQMLRDNAEIPPILEKCCEAIEKYGMRNQGIYRVSGTTSKVAALRAKLDRDLDAVDLDSPEWSSDINNVASVLKMWLRELPDPLMTFELHSGFIDAAKIENDRLRHIRLHERVNDLPDPNYATLKYFLGHLYKINQHEDENSMSMQNLAIVFGPTLFGQIPPQPANGVNGNPMNGSMSMADTAFQNTAIETILNHYNDIFVDETE